MSLPRIIDAAQFPSELSSPLLPQPDAKEVMSGTEVIVQPPGVDPSLVRVFEEDNGPPRVRLSSQSYRDAVGGIPLVEKYRTPRKDESNEKQPPETKPVNTVKLFRYATALDILLLLLGTLAAIIHGAAFPFAMVIFGDITNAFVNHEASGDLVSLQTPLDFRNITGGVVDCGATYTFGTNFTLEEALHQYISNDTSCLDDDSFIAEINRLVFIFLGIAGGALLAAFIQYSLFQMAAERQVHKIRLLFYRSILRQEIGWFDTNPGGELTSRLSEDIEKIHAAIGDNLAILIQWVTTFLAAYVVGFLRDWRLALVLLGVTPILAVVAAVFAKATSVFAVREQKEYASAAAIAEEVLSSIRTVAAFGGERRETQRYDSHLASAKRTGSKKGVAVGTSIGLVFFMIFVFYCISFWFGAYLVSEQLAQTGDVITVFFAILVGAFYVGQSGPNLERLATAQGAAGVLYDIIDTQPTIDASSDEGLVPEKSDSTIQFNNVCFSYPTRPDVKVLNGMNFSVSMGQTVALVGPSGCGKSTVVQLLQRFYDVNEGEILVGGKDVRALNLKWLRGNIGLVSQEPVLFDTTIAENIRYGKEGATMEEIEAAARNANAHDFISELPNGYNTLVGERGTQLSGGQKQRVAIARALVRDPKILLLDEATSALDSQSESIVQNCIDRAREGRTTIIIAHRLSTIQTADVIASIEDGRVVEMGTHAELMASKGLYYDLVSSQSSLGDVVPPPEGPHFEQAWVRRTKSVRCTRSSRGGTCAQRTRVWSQATERSRAQSLRAVGSRVRRTFSKVKPDEPVNDVDTERSVSVSHRRYTAPPKETPQREEEEEEEELPDVSLLQILRVNGREWWLMALGVLGAVVNGATFPAFAVIFGEVLEVFSQPAGKVLEATHLWAGLFLVLGTAAAIGLFIKNVCFSISGEYLTSRLRSRLFRAMLRQEIAWHDEEKNSTSALTGRLSSDAGQVQGASGVRVGTLLEMGVGLVLAVVVGFVYSWILTFVVLGIMPVIVISAALHVQLTTGANQGQYTALQTAREIAVESIEVIDTVVALGAEERFYNRFKTEVEKPYRQNLALVAVSGITYGVSQSMIFFGYIIAFRFGAFQVTLDNDHLLHTEFQNVYRVFAALIFGGLAIGAASSFAPDYAKAKLAAQKVFYLLDSKPTFIDIFSEEGYKIPQQSLSGAIRVQDVIFAYPARPDVKVLRGMNASVKPGQTLALVGTSGSGKSTVVSLIERFYDPDAGSLALDGSDLRDLNLHWLRSQIGVVSQEPVLFDASIAENIRYGALFREVSDEEVIEAAKAANIHNFIESLPQGYNTNVGGKGTQLSGGQKQRVAIARALVRDPKVLLLDEATSALDTESEKIVQEALDRAREGRTSIVIAHRLSTIYGADCIAVIKRGRVVESGTHSELLAQKGIYYQLNRLQHVQPKTPERLKIANLDQR